MGTKAPDKKKKKKDDESEGVHRLSDIRTKEVSIVDRGANKRRFLVVKREEMGKPAATATNPNAQPSGDAKPGKPAETKPVAKTDEPAGDPPTSEPAVTEPPAGADTGAAATNADPPADPEDDQKLSPEVAKSLQDLGAQISELAKASDLGEVQIKLADIGDALNEIAKIEVFRDPAQYPNTDTGGVAKAGSKMAGKRLERLEGAVKALSDIVKELRTPAKKSDPPAAPAPTPTAKADQTNPPADPAPAAGMDPDLKETLQGMQKSMEQMAKGIEGLTRVAKTHGDRIEKITKNYGGGNQDGFDGEDVTPATQEVSWPLDLNSPPPPREAVEKKGTSFY